MEYNTKGKVLKKAVVWKNLYFYRKSDAIYQLTVEFCKRFLPPYGDSKSERQQRLRDFCHDHNDYIDYEPLVVKMNDEEMANLLLTLCHQTDKLMCAYIEKLEKQFVTEGGIKERMYAARTGYRQQQDAHMRALETENQQLKAELAALKAELAEFKAKTS